MLGSKEESVTKALNELKSENENYIVDGYCPNLSDLKSVEETFKNVKEKLEIVLVDHMDQVLEHALVKDGEKNEN